MVERLRVLAGKVDADYGNVRSFTGYNRLQEAITEVTLYDLENDIGETTNVANKHPDVVANLMRFVEQARADLGDANVGVRGKGVRTP